MTDENPFAPPTPRAARPAQEQPQAPAAQPVPEQGAASGKVTERLTAPVPMTTLRAPSGTFGATGADDAAGTPDDAPARPRRGRGGVVAGVVLLSLLAGAGGGAGAYALLDAQGPARPADVTLPQPAAGGAAPVERPEGSVAAIAAATLPSVVSIEVRAAQGVATGSGLILQEDGYILTNNHVVAEAAGGADVVVTFSDGHEQEAELIGATPDYDLAVIRVDETGLEPLVLGDSDEVVVGDAVLAVGSPLGLEATVTTGIVSALHRPVKAGEAAVAAFIDAIQTDAAINPGNSGGPLVNSAGGVIGINSAIAQGPGTTTATGNIGLGFAIPSNQARHTAEQLIETATAT